MRKNHETTDLLAVLRKSKKPMTADQIAKAAKTLRNRAAPFLKLMVSNGQILELRDDEQSAPKFVVNLESADAIAPAATTPAKAPAKPAAAKAGAAKAKTGTAAKTPTAAKASAATTATSNVHQLRPSDKPAPAAPVTSPVTGEDKRMEILRLLAVQPMMKSEIVQKLGDVEGLLKELKAEGLVTDSYIISDYTWELTEEAYAKYPELLNPVEPVAPEAAPAAVAAPAAKATEQASLPLEAPASAPAAAPKAAAAKKPAAPAPKPPAAKPAAAKPAPAAVAQAPAAAPTAGEINPLSELSMTVAAVVEKLFQERLGDMAAELESKNKQIEENQQLITEIAAGITECTDAFQVAISALNKFAAKISKLA